MKLPFLGRGGRKEAGEVPPSGTLPKLEIDPYASIVSFYRESKQPMYEVRRELGESYRDEQTVEKIAARIEVARLAKSPDQTRAFDK